MPYEFNFGTLGSAPPKRSGKGSEVFRLAILGDFSARANRGEVEVGEALASRKPLTVDIDNLDDLISRMEIKLHLDVGGEDGTIEVEIASIDEFHPEELYDRLEIFSRLSGLRRQLTNSATFPKAAKEVQAWLGISVPKKKRRRRKSRGSVVAADCRLSDFAKLLERDGPEREATPIDNLIQQIVGPHVLAAKDPRQDVLIAAVDSAISDTMRRILHHPDFQTTEALWRSVDLLTRGLETGTNLKIVLYDITAEELAADLGSAETLEESGLYKLLVEKPAMDAQQGAISAIIGNYLFEQTPPHAELLGRMAKIAAAAQAPFIAAISTECMNEKRSADEHPLIAESWSALKKLPEASYLALTVPRFMLRNPYGAKTEPIDRFDFEEFTPQYGLRGMLWGNSANLAGLLLGQTFTKQGLKKMNVGSVMTVGDMPYYYYTDADGDQIALPCTERLVNVRMAEQLSAQGFIPVISILNRPEVRLASFRSIGGKWLSGPWPAAVAQTLPPIAPKKSSPEPEEEDSSDGDSSDDSSSSDDSDSDSSSDSSGGDDLDALLASMGDSSSESEPAAEDSGEVDADLAALLAELG